MSEDTKTIGLDDFVSGTKEYMDFSLEIKAIDESGVFEGYAAVYGNRDLGGDVIEPFAAERSLKRSGGKMHIYRNHSMKVEDIVGENIEGSEDKKGFKIKGALDLDRPSGLDTYRAMLFAKKHGNPMGLSIGFMANRKKIDYIADARHLKEIDIIEYSIVPMAMNPKAKVTSVKSFIEGADEYEISLKKREIEASLRDAGCSREERKAALSAIFIQRDADENEEKAAQEIEQEEKADAELLAEVESILNRITTED